MSTPPTGPSSIRWTDEGFNALLSLEATIKKARYLIVMDSLVEKHNRTVAMAPLQCRLLPPSGILTLQAEVAKIEKRHADNRQKVMIRTSDKHATEKIIKVVEKIDSETSELQRLRLKLGVIAQLPESLSPEDLESVNAIAAALEKTAIEMANMTEMIAQLESERDEARAELATELGNAAIECAKITAGIARLEGERDQARAQLAAMISKYEKSGKLAEVAESLTDHDRVNINALIQKAKEQIEKSKQICPSNIPIFETELKILTSLLP